jgi:enoyl-CoA hydratase
MGIEVRSGGGIAEVVIDFPPVNALPVRGWFDLAEAISSAGDDAEVRAVILAADGRGFCAGVDIKEMQRTPGHTALIGANRGCFAAFAAVYECAVPVIAAVHGFCLGGGVGLAGNADIVIASDDASFGLPEVDRGALGAATHLSRLVPQQLMRTMVYTCRTVTARQLLAFGTVLDVVPAGQLREAARSVAAEIAGKDGEIIRLAKQSLNGIDPVDVRRSYRYEQGFTYELNLTGISDAARQSFVDQAGKPKPVRADPARADPVRAKPRDRTEQSHDAGRGGTSAGRDGTSAGRDGTSAGRDGTGTGRDGTNAGRDGTGTGRSGT